MHKADRARKITGTSVAGKAIVMGILDRSSGKVRVKHVRNVQRETLQGEVREHINIFLGEENVRYLDGLATPVPDGAEVTIVPAISGG